MAPLFFNTMKKFYKSLHSPQMQKRVESLIAHKGLEGYGLYWVLIGLLREEDNKLEYDLSVLSWQTGAPRALLDCVCSEFFLFRIVGGWLESIELFELMEEKQVKSAKARLSVQSRWNKQSTESVVAVQEDDRSEKSTGFERIDLEGLSVSVNVSPLFENTNVSKNDTNVLTSLDFNELQSHEKNEKVAGLVVYTTSSLSLEEEEKYHGIVYQKRNKEKTNKKEKKRKELDLECHEFANWFRSLLPDDIAARVKEKDLENWADTYDKLIRVDKHPREEIKAVVEFGRSGWWAKNFLSPMKLRRPDKDGTPYYTVFYNQMRTERNGTARAVQERHSRRAQLFGLEE